MKIVKESTLSRVNKNSDSLRTTVPSAIKELLDLYEGDRIRWVCKCGHRATVEVSVSSRNQGEGA